MTNYKKYHHSVSYITINNNTVLHNTAEDKMITLSWNSITGKVNWLTTRLIIHRKLLIPVVICYPSGIFIQIKKINKRKYFLYSTR